MMATEIISDSSSHFAPSSSGLRRTKSSQSALYATGSPTLTPRSRRKDRNNSKRPSPTLNRSSPALYTPSPTLSNAYPTPSSNHSSSDESDDDDDDIGYFRLNQEEIGVPILNIETTTSLDPETQGPPPSPQPSSSPPGKSDEVINVASSSLHLASKAEDDMAAVSMPSRQVDYLSHEWREEEIWASWSYIVARRKLFGERSRLENASWRSWAKQKNNLSTISPKNLNWMKDCDVTWLYGPLQHPSYYSEESEPTSQLSKTNSFLINKKPILKKRSMSEMMLQKSLSASSLVREAAAAVQAQRRPKPHLDRRTSDYSPEWISSKGTSHAGTDYFSSQSTSGLQTPSDHSEKKHIRFATKVEQCIAVDIKDDNEEEEEEEPTYYNDDDDDDSDSEGGVVMMKKTNRRKRPQSRPKHRRSSSAGSSRRGSSSETRTTIQMLPATTLKDRVDSPDPHGESQSHSLRPSSSWSRSSKLSPSPSVETLRPSDPERNFLIPDDDEIWSIQSNGFEKARERERREEFEDVGGAMRRTASGMLMPVDDETQDPAFRGIVGRMLDTVNTARDIAHVIWNVGWNKAE